MGSKKRQNDRAKGEAAAGGASSSRRSAERKIEILLGFERDRFEIFLKSSNKKWTRFDF